MEKRHILSAPTSSSYGTLRNSCRKVPKITTSSILVLATGLGAQWGFICAGFNLPQEILEEFVNRTFCSSGLCRAHPTVTQLTFLWSSIVVVAFLGLIPAILSGASLSDRFGRKTVMLSSGALIVLSLMTQFASFYFEDPFTLLTGRFLHGLGTGWSTISVATFLLEISPKTIRHVHRETFLVSKFTWILVFIAFGLPGAFGTSARWPFLLILPLLAELPSLILLFAIPESPKQLFREGSSESRLMASFNFYHGSAVDPQRYWEDCSRELRLQKEGSKSGFAAIPTEWRKDPSQKQYIVLVLLCGLAQQLTFSMSLTLFSTEIFVGHLGFGIFGARNGTLVVFALVFLSLIGSYFYVEKLRRRRIILTSLVAATLAQAVMFLVTFSLYYFQPTLYFPWLVKYLGLAAFAVMLVSHTLGTIHVQVRLAKECLNPVIKNPVLTVAMALGLAVDFFVTGGFLPLTRSVGPPWPWLISLFLLFSCWAYLLLAFPNYETDRWTPSTVSTIPHDFIDRLSDTSCGLFFLGDSSSSEESDSSDENVGARDRKVSAATTGFVTAPGSVAELDRTK